jgi:hypothetical protein
MVSIVKEEHGKVAGSVGRGGHTPSGEVRQLEPFCRIIELYQAEIPADRDDNKIIISGDKEQSAGEIMAQLL